MDVRHQAEQEIQNDETINWSDPEEIPDPKPEVSNKVAPIETSIEDSSVEDSSSETSSSSSDAARASPESGYQSRQDNPIHDDLKDLSDDATADDDIEVLSGLRVGERIAIPGADHADSARSQSGSKTHFVRLVDSIR